MANIHDKLHVQPFVPQGARIYIEECLYGVPGEQPGFFSIYEKHDCVAKIVREDIAASVSRHPPRKNLYPGLQTSEYWRRIYEERIARIRRLCEDPRMATVYAKLAEECTNDADLSRFLSAAWRAAKDFSTLRKEKAAAKQLLTQVDELAQKLAQTLNEIQSSNTVNAPEAFTSIWHLLNYRKDVESVLYQPPLDEEAGLALSQNQGEVSLPRQRLDERATKQALPTEAYYQQVAIDYRVIADTLGEDEAKLYKALSKTPRVSALLLSLAGIAKDVEPQMEESTTIAIASRKENAKVSYIRAFGALLGEGEPISINANVMHAIAATANVVLNEPDVDISYDDVRKALK